MSKDTLSYETPSKRETVDPRADIALFCGFVGLVSLVLLPSLRHATPLQRDLKFIATAIVLLIPELLGVVTGIMHLGLSASRPVAAGFGILFGLVGAVASLHALWPLIVS